MKSDTPKLAEFELKLSYRENRQEIKPQLLRWDKLKRSQVRALTSEQSIQSCKSNYF